MITSGPKASGQIQPLYSELKDLHLATDLVREGTPCVTVVAPAGGECDAPAVRIREAIHRRSGVWVPVVRDDDPEAAVPIRGNLLVLGNRTTSRTIEELYNRYFTLLDLWYPGPGGWEVRSLHNPFGGGHNVFLVGGSDGAGVERAAEVFVGKLEQAQAGRGRLTVGWLMEIGLGTGMKPPTDFKEFEIWEACGSSGSTGYFGWNSLSKRLAMYYMTGDPVHAREFIRLAFPDEQAKRHFTEIDGELIENKDDPLAGPYHYGACMMILYWDLIEESPVFTDEERLRVTNAFSRQFAHPREQGWRARIPEEIARGETAYAEPPPCVWSRHEQCSGIALYCLARYFHRDYGDPLWAQCAASAVWRFSSLHYHAWVNGEDDTLPSYCSATAPILQYMLLTGDRKPLENGNLAKILRGQEILLSGQEREPHLAGAAISYLRQAAYLTQDGRYLEYLRRTGMDLDVFRLGQSYAPEPHLRPTIPEDLVGRWSVHPLPEPMWRSRNSGPPLEESFMVASFRSAPDASGDFLLVKGWNPAVRNPYHTFAVLELSLAGQVVLKGYLNQVVTRADGLVEPGVAMDAALRHHGVVGQTAVVVGETPDAPFCCWRRTILQRIGRYALIVDRLGFRADSPDMEAEILWQGGPWRIIGPGVIRAEKEGRAWVVALSDPVETSFEGGRMRMAWYGAVEKGSERTFFSLVAGAAEGSPVCARLALNAAALACPEPGIIVTGDYEGVSGELVVLAQDHLHGMGLREASLGAALLSADRPVDVDWDFGKGALHIVTRGETRVRLRAQGRPYFQGGTPRESTGRDGNEDGWKILDLSEGRHHIEEASPDPGALRAVSERLSALLAEAAKNRDGQEAREKSKPSARIPSLSAGIRADVGGPVVDLVTIPAPGGALSCAAEGHTVHVLTTDGKEIRRMTTDGPIRVLRWWPERRLLLAGCVDEKVVAFDVDTGKQRWTFTSEMDPEVFRRGKPYWFKSAPGHEGVHGLCTGTFFEGRVHVFVGSACTLEILDEAGRLVRRMPVLWGPITRLALIDGPEGSANLLIAREPTDSHALAVVNSRTPEPAQRGFSGVPAGHTNIGGWDVMSRDHIFYTDVDGDGNKEVVSEINGSWNRVTVWSSDGTPLHNVNLGPGHPIPARNVRDLDVADLDGDGKQEIVVGLAGGLVLLLDHRCEKTWSKRLSAPPTVLACVKDRKPWIAVGCEDGTLIALDGKGEVVGMGHMQGRPTRIAVLDGMAVVGTDSGQVVGWATGRDARGGGSDLAF